MSMDTGGGSTFVSDAYYRAVSAVVQHCLYYLINNLLISYCTVVMPEGLQEVKRRGFTFTLTANNLHLVCASSIHSFIFKSKQQVGLHLIESQF